MKGCLKHPTPVGSPAPCTRDSPPPKSVAFGPEEQAAIYPADEWDRTPTEPSRNLSYQDLLELKEIQNSLPRANQPPDLFNGRAKHYLSGVPVALLRLLPDDAYGTPPPSAASSEESSRNSSGYSSPVRRDSSPVRSGSGSRNASPSRVWVQPPPVVSVPPLDCTANGGRKDWTRISFKASNKAPGFSTPTPTPTSSSPSSPTPCVTPTPTPSSNKSIIVAKPFIQPPPQPTPPISPWTPPHLAHLAPKSVYAQRPKPRFTFLPLLDPSAPPLPSESSKPTDSIPSTTTALSISLTLPTPVSPSCSSSSTLPLPPDLLSGSEPSPPTPAPPHPKHEEPNQGKEKKADPVILQVPPSDATLDVGHASEHQSETYSDRASIQRPPRFPTRTRRAFVHTDTETETETETDAETEAETDPPTPALTNVSLELEVGDHHHVEGGGVGGDEVGIEVGVGMGLGLGTEGYFASHRHHHHSMNPKLDRTPTLEPTRQPPHVLVKKQQQLGSVVPLIRAMPSPGLVPPSPLVLEPSEKGGRERKKRFIVINDIEVELDDDE